MSDWTRPELPYRVAYTHKHWKGKPDPSGFGKGFIYMGTLASAERYAERQAEQGCTNIRIQTRPSL